jgi:hypothetical protein
MRICCVPSGQQHAYELQQNILVYKMSGNLNVLTQFYCTLELRRAVKKFSEMWYSTEMVGHMTKQIFPICT